MAPSGVLPATTAPAEAASADGHDTTPDPAAPSAPQGPAAPSGAPGQPQPRTLGNDVAAPAAPLAAVAAAFWTTAEREARAAHPSTFFEIPVSPG
ncbi:MAG TPA: hypothetical protein VKY71_04700 [Actinotalea caeni]|uniref:hypothetical protein n=1 Tax=Actinotalea caeni TaxID=1348467 RepID=UPI002B4B8E62|nr:hypothetical protein [Actinotalea caeni]HLV54854.1 hypothetical protein [Actinotalea caeni]